MPTLHDFDMKVLNMMKYTVSQFSLLVLICLGALSMQAQPPAGYYNSAQGLSGTALHQALHDIIDDHVEFPYTDPGTDTWDILQESDKDPNNSSNVMLIYNDTSVNGPQEYNSGNGWSREHVWPQSLLGAKSDTLGSATDVHNLKPADISANSSRGNKEYDNGGSPHGSIPDTYTDTDSWEPRDSVKGDVARIIFYMDVRYEGDKPDEQQLVMDSFTNGGVYTFGNMGTLLQWHEQDPVSNWERNRNDVIYSYQQNRNPFIDHPEWVDSIWGSGAGSTPTQASIGFASATSSVPEGNSGSVVRTIDVTLSNYQGAPVSVEITDAGTGTATNSGSDYNYTTQSLTFSGNGTQTVDITVYGDITAESNETVDLDLAITSGTATTSITGHTFTISDDEAPNAWINEFHYDNDGGDTGEFIEVVIEDATGYNLADFTVTLYNGNGGSSYDSETLNNFTVGTAYGAFTVYTWYPSSIQNGAPDGFSLDYNGTIIQFLSYEGTLQATNGPASGMTSTDIGVSEPSSTQIGESLQLTHSSGGMGISYSDFVWNSPAAETPGTQNTNQVLPEHYSAVGSWYPSAPDATSSSADVYIASGSNALSGDAIIGNLEVDGGASLTLSASTTLTINGDYTNNGTVTVTDGSSVLMDAATSITGDMTVQREGTLYSNVFNYWSSPVNQPDYTSVWGSSYNTNDLYELDATGQWTPITTTQLVNGKGYAMTGLTAGGTNIVSFTGTPNNGTITVPVANGTYQCVGNPYPSAISVVDFINMNHADITGNVWFWHMERSGIYDSLDYAMRNLAGGVRGSRYGNTMPGDYIASGQGFVVKTPGGASSVTFDNTLRVANNNQQFFRSTQDLQRVWLMASYEQSAIWNQLLLAFTPDATDSVDWGYDGAKIKANAAISFYSLIDGEPYAIQSRGELTTAEVAIPLGLDAVKAGEYTIAIDSLDQIDKSVTIHLRNTKTGVLYDLRKGPHTLTVSAANEEVRDYEVVFNADIASSIPTQSPSSATIAQLPYGWQVTGTAGAIIERVQLFDMQGRQVYTGLPFQSQVVVAVPHLAKGMYIMSLTTAQGQSQHKVNWP